MASIFSRKRKHGVTWYLQYYVDGKVIQKKVGKSKTLAKKVAGEIEARQERKDANLEPRDYGIREFLQEYLDFIPKECLTQLSPPQHNYHKVLS